MTERRLDVDLDDDDTYFVITEALREFSSRQRFEADGEDDESIAQRRIKWADLADELRDRIENA